MNIQLYNNTSTPNTIDKNVELVKNYSGTLASAFSYSGGVVTIRAAEPIICNYAYIPTLGRYYFVDNVTLYGDTCELTLRVDVLMTFADSIRQAIATRVKGGSNFYNSNNGGVYDSRRITEKIEFGNSEFFTDEGDIVLITLRV